MSIYRYERVERRDYKRGRCVACGKTAERSQTFQQTINPFNKNSDGAVKTRDDIWTEISAEARAWLAQPVFHARCENPS
jgi:hypothetical protein